MALEKNVLQRKNNNSLSDIIFNNEDYARRIAYREIEEKGTERRTGFSWKKLYR
jgi:hypothetical protein